MPGEDAALTAALPDAANGWGPWQQSFRVGWLDLPLLDYACRAVGRLDQLAVTCLDRARELPALKVCAAYTADGERIARLPLRAAPTLVQQARLGRALGACRPVLSPVADEAALLEQLSGELGVPVGCVSDGPGTDRKVLLDGVLAAS